MTDARLARIVMERIEALSHISDDKGRLTRTYASPAMRKANNLVGSWMREAGMTVREDAIGNVIGRYEAAQADAKTFLLGSHLDTVRDAGKFDGPLGVLVAIACLQRLHQTKTRLPFAIEVVGFADEEGVRFQSTYLGSRALAGTFNIDDLKRSDENGIPLAEAMLHFGGDPAGLHGAKRAPNDLLGYAEVHIEQGPVLEKLNVPVAVVSTIVGQTRILAHFTGRAGHAGTTPMSLRQDALPAAAAFILKVESTTLDDPQLVATVGQLKVIPNASNVIPGDVILTVDIRHPDDARRNEACEGLARAAREIAGQRRLAFDWEIVQETNSVSCASELMDLLRQAVRNVTGSPSRLLPSGAGHDAAALAAITPVAMLFVRCKEGISHHPDESVQVADVQVAIAVMNDFLRLLARQYA